MYKIKITRPKQKPEDTADKIFNEVCAILKKVPSLTTSRNNVVQFVDGESLHSLKEDITCKLIQLQRKHYETVVSDKLINPYGHKYSSTLNSYKPKKYQNDAINYCIIIMCMHEWNFNRAATNTAINRIVKVLSYLKEHDKDRYNQINALLWESELPFREGGQYSRLLIFYPPLQKDKFSGEELMDLFPKTEGLHDEDAAFLKRISALRVLTQEKKWDELSDENRNDITMIVEKMILRNTAIFLMLLFQLHGSLRLRYFRECDRIISSDFFRYLQYKTQVMIKLIRGNRRGKDC